MKMPRFSLGDRIEYTGPDDSRVPAVFERYEGMVWAWVRVKGIRTRIKVRDITTTVVGRR